MGVLPYHVQVQCCFMSIMTVEIIRDGEPRTPPRPSHSSWALILSSLLFLFIFQRALVGVSFYHVQVQCCLTSTETVGTVRDWEPRTTTSTFTQLMSSDSVSSYYLLLYFDVRLWACHSTVFPYSLLYYVGVHLWVCHSISSGYLWIIICRLALQGVSFCNLAWVWLWPTFLTRGQKLIRYLSYHFVLFVEFLWRVISWGVIVSSLVIC